MKTPKIDKRGKLVRLPARRETAAEGGTEGNSSGGIHSREQLFRAMEALKKLPDVRADAVADIRRRIAEGKYRIEVRAIADRLLRSSLESED
ncbi:MAG: flagellar biosynthesis anti-sigma factor FlgM [Desulfobacterales bacterium]